MKTNNRDIDAWLDEQMSCQPIKATSSFNAEVLERLKKEDRVIDPAIDAFLKKQAIEPSVDFERKTFRRLRNVKVKSSRYVFLRFAMPVGIAAALTIGLFVQTREKMPNTVPTQRINSPLSDFSDEQIAMLSEMDFSTLASDSKPKPTPFTESDLEMMFLL